jgi:hypothetical protein
MFRSIATISIADDRGAPCLLVPPPTTWPKDLNWSLRTPTIEDPALRAEYELARKTSGWYGGLIGTTMIGTIAAAQGLLSMVGLTGVYVSLAAPVLAGVACWPLYRPIARYFRSAGAGELRDAYFASSRCACCGFDLAGLPPETDLCVVCPECGAAWAKIHDSAAGPAVAVSMPA